MNPPELSVPLIKEVPSTNVVVNVHIATQLRDRDAFQRASLPKLAAVDLEPILRSTLRLTGQV